VCRVLARRVEEKNDVAVDCLRLKLFGQHMEKTPVVMLGNSAGLGEQLAYADLGMKAHHAQLLHTQVQISTMLETLPLANVKLHVLCLFVQAGSLLLKASTRETSSVHVALLDDLDGIYTVTADEQGNAHTLSEWRMWTHARIRHQMNVFLLLFRVLFLAMHATQAPEPQGDLHEIHEFHREASMDRFYELSMRFDLPPGAVLVYMHLFSGMYNSVSQVVYYNFPQYERRKQMVLADLNKGIYNVFTMAPLLELEPDVKVLLFKSPLSRRLHTTFSTTLLLEQAQTFWSSAMFHFGMHRHLSEFVDTFDEPYRRPFNAGEKRGANWLAAMPPQFCEDATVFSRGDTITIPRLAGSLASPSGTSERTPFPGDGPG